MIRHRAYTLLGCRWLTTGLTHNLNADNLSPGFTLLGCQWLTTGLTHNGHDFPITLETRRHALKLT